MIEIKLYIYKVIEMDKMRGVWCLWKIRRGCLCYFKKIQGKST